MDIIRKITVCFQWVILSLFVVVHYGCIVESSSNNYTEAGYNWPIYGGNNLGNRYSPLDQINKTNVAELKPVWIYDSNLPGQANKGQIQCQPIVIDEILYGTSSDLRLRSEEHTSELQSRENLVCRLLHEKKKRLET